MYNEVLFQALNRPSAPERRLFTIEEIQLAEAKILKEIYDVHYKHMQKFGYWPDLDPPEIKSFLETERNVQFWDCFSKESDN